MNVHFTLGGPVKPQHVAALRIEIDDVVDAVPCRGVAIPDEDVGACTADQPVGAATAPQFVVARPALEKIPAARCC